MITEHHLKEHLTDFQHIIHESSDGDDNKQLILVGNMLTNHFRLVILKNGEPQKEWFHVTKYDRALEYYKSVN